MKVLTNLAYRSGPELSEYETTRCKLDLYVPEGKGADLPCLVWFHGGGITAGDKEGKTAQIAESIAKEGYIVAAVNYRLSPKATYPSYIEDAAASVAWVIQHAKEHGGNPAKVFVSGHSAGGYLTTMLALDPKYLGKHGIKPETILGYMPVAGQMITHAAVRAERGIGKDVITVDEAAPLYHVRKDLPPLLVLHAEKDMKMRSEENRFFAEALTAAGNKNFEIHEVAGHDHGGVGNRISEPGDAGRLLLLKFMATRLAAAR